jgi:two-component system, response regulator PdtaR
VTVEPLRILIVEDEILIAFELESLLEDEGYDAAGIAATLTDALDLARELSPDLALVDVHLADGPTGVEVARALTGRGVTVLFMTANAKRIPDDFAGAIGVIAKPYTERSVRSAVQYVMDRLSGVDPGVVPENMTLSPAWKPSRSPRKPPFWAAQRPAD